MRSYLLGYDLRLCEGDYVRSEWSPERRSTYLLRKDVRWPLTVDPLAWPSWFSLSGSAATAVAIGPRAEAIRVEPNTVVKSALQLWDDRDAMKRVFERRGRAACAVQVAVELWHDRELSGDVDWDFIVESLPSGRRDEEGWVDAGYDVADRYLVSGLVNCGYTADDRTSLDGWSSRLNAHGLFEKVEDAAAFRVLTNARVPEHAPFYVYRLRVDL